LAQTSRGSFKIDGNLGYSHASETSEYSYGGSPTYKSEITYSSLHFQPTVSYFVIKRLAVGGAINLNRSSTIYESQNNREVVSTSITFGPSVEYYIPLTKSFFFVPQASVLWGRTDADGYTLVGGDVMVPSETEGSTRRIDAGLGLTYFLNSHVGVDFLLNYSHTRTEFEYGYYQSETLKRGAYSVGVGLSVFLFRGE
jgi:outer membrane autotransporter protein